MDYASANCPTGKSAGARGILSSPLAKNISLRASPKSNLQLPTSRLNKRGVSRSSRTWSAGCGGRGSVGARGNRRASFRERSAGARTNGAAADGEVVWSWHPLLVSSLAEVFVGPTGRVKPFNPRGDGGKKELVTEESSKEAVKTIAQGRPDDPAPPVVTTVCFLPMHTGRGCEPSTRPSLRPLSLEGQV